MDIEPLLGDLQGEAREARRELLERLASDGVPPEELRRAVETDQLAFMPLERAFESDGRRYTANEIAAESGLDYEGLTELWQSLGMAAMDPEEAVFTEDDLQAARTAREALELGVPRDALMEILRVAGHGMSQLAATIRAAMGPAVFQPGDNEYDAALRAVDVERATRPHLEGVLSYALRIHMRDQLRSDMVGFAEISSGRLAEGREMTVCFADLVGFTRLGERIPAEELGALAGRFATLARETACAPVHLVKTIGDAVMLVSPDTDPLLRSALDLCEATGSEGEAFPQIRVGVARGPALSRAGDWYGRPVNLASRVTGIARRGAVLTTAEVKESAAGDYSWSEAGLFRVKGVQGRVPLWRLRPPRADQ